MNAIPHALRSAVYVAPPRASFAAEAWVATGHAPDVLVEALTSAIERGFPPGLGEVLADMADAIDGKAR